MFDVHIGREDGAKMERWKRYQKERWRKRRELLERQDKSEEERGVATMEQIWKGKRKGLPFTVGILPQVG